MTATGTTFNSLLQSLKDAVERGASTDVAFLRELPQIVNRAERSLADKLKIQGYRTVLQGTLVSQSPIVAKPTNWRSTVTFSIGTLANFNSFKLLRKRSYELIRQAVPDPTQYNQPQWYCDWDFNNWLMAPTPDQNYPFESIVYLLPPLLASDNQTNYLTQFVPNLILFECLKNLEPFLKNDARIQTWTELRDAELAGIDKQEMAKIVDRTQTRTSD